MRVEKYYIRCNARRCIENTADTWLVLRLPRREISKCSTIGHGSYSIQIGRTVSFPTPTALLLRFLTFSLSPFFLFVRSISFSPSSFLLLPPSDRKQIRDTAAAQQQVVRFACRVFRVTRGNRHGNLIFTEKLIIPAVSCIYTIVDRVSSKAYHRRLGTGGIIAWPPIREREREREEEETRVVSGNFAAIVIGDWQKAPHTSFYYSYDFVRDKKYLYCWSTIVVLLSVRIDARLNREFGRKYPVDISSSSMPTFAPFHE